MIMSSSDLSVHRRDREAPVEGDLFLRWSDELITAFVQGAKWWEYHKTGATMWPSDTNVAKLKAEYKALDGTLGKSLNAGADAPRT